MVGKLTLVPAAPLGPWQLLSAQRHVPLDER